MTLYLLSWKIMDVARVPCMTYFGSMTPEDDARDAAGVEILGRWGEVGNASGTCICRAQKYTDVANWAYNWVPMATIDVKPICDDNVARKIVLGKEPDYMVSYEHVSDEPQEGETLYQITYKFHESKKVEGYKQFAGLTKEQDEGDAGDCRPLGRWHLIGEGSGMAIAAAKSEADLYKWAFNWTGICDCVVVPVLTDAQCRKVITGKPDFQEKLQEVKVSMGMVKKSSTCC